MQGRITMKARITTTIAVAAAAALGLVASASADVYGHAKPGDSYANDVYRLPKTDSFDWASRLHAKGAAWNARHFASAGWTRADAA
jgi:hypothetical protein